MSELNLFQKLVEVRKVVPYLQKTESGGQYQYVGSSQVLSAVRDKMDELNLLLIPSIVDKTLHQSAIEQFNKDSDRPFKRTITFFTELEMKMTWVNADKPDEQIEIPWYAQGVDIAGEKGVGKALTYGEKYFLLKQFNIATDKDDPDAFQEKVEKSKPEKMITSNTIGEIKTLALKFGKLRNQTEEAVYKAAGIFEIEKLTEKQAQSIIGQLKAWISVAEKNNQEVTK
ncbi:ERF family protein [Alkalicoccobacillus gibsonii]|uniref:ERF family protein n=1 Tax=Alkalicoccobacillus gibsonii TaxID=79881 RepID=UPI003F7C6D69